MISDFAKLMSTLDTVPREGSSAADRLQDLIRTNRSAIEQAARDRVPRSFSNGSVRITIGSDGRARVQI